MSGKCIATPAGCWSKQWQNHGYLFCQPPLSWADASAACKAAGKHLVTINDDAENTWVYNETLAGVGWWWIGFNDLKTEGQWVWEDGTPVGYTNWEQSEPNDLGGEDCANLGFYQGALWNDLSCSETGSYICESPLVCTTVCNGLCVDLQYDNNNCGACGAKCDTTGGFQCQWGKCACVGGLTECLGKCVDLTSDPANCGNCGNTCGAGEYCASGVCFALGKWVIVAAGTFVMGSPPNEPCRESCHGKETQHNVTLTHDFEISATEVTQGEFLALTGYNPASPTSCGPTCPAESVNWHQAASYCNALSSNTGLASCYSCNGTGPAVTCTEAAAYSGGKIYSCPGYRLPTDAEWEYAYRAGSTTALYPTAGNNGLLTSCSGFDPNADKIGWYNDNSNGTPHPVGTKPPNAWGLYGMAGNAHEWCHDRWQPDLGSSTTIDPWGSASGSDRVLRSGSWICPANEMRAACRFGIAPTITQNVEFGFRPCRTLFP